MKKLSLGIAIFLMSTAAGALDSAIRVMAVVTSDANPVAVATQLDRLELVWDQSVDVLIPIELVS